MACDERAISSRPSVKPNMPMPGRPATLAQDYTMTGMPTAPECIAGQPWLARQESAAGAQGLAKPPSRSAAAGAR